MRYMGHAEISSTLYYFRFVPDFYPTFQGISCKTESLIPEVTYEEAQH
jgi:integrase/recombinase XerD